MTMQTALSSLRPTAFGFDVKGSCNNNAIELLCTSVAASRTLSRAWRPSKQQTGLAEQLCCFCTGPKGGFSLLPALAGLVFLVTVPACGTGAEPDAKPAVVEPALSARTKQQLLKPQEWSAVLAAHPSLNALAKATGLPLQAAGVIETADQTTLNWGEYASQPYDDRSAVQTAFVACDAAKVCTVGKGSHSATGAALTDAAGAPLAKVSVGSATLLKTVKSDQLIKDNTVWAALNRNTRVDTSVAKNQLQRLGAWNQRRFVLLNAYGPQVGLSATAIRDAAQKTGLYDEVLIVDFVRRADVESLLPSMTPLDTLVWIGATVLDQAGQTPVGMTTSRGIFGDELYHKKNLDNLLATPPLGGPGLIVLAGSTSMPLAGSTTSFGSELALSPHRPVVGFGGKVTWGTLTASVVGLLNALGAGKDLETAMVAASADLPQKLMSNMDKDARLAWKLPVKSSAFWAGKPPTATALQIYVKVDPLCMKSVDSCDATGFKAASKQANNQVAAESLEAGAAKFDCNPTFVGPFFECKAQNAVTFTDFVLKGVLRGKGVGDRFFFYLEGSPNAQYKDMAVVGEGQIEKVDSGGGTDTVYFRGVAAASPYYDKDGHCCQAKSPLLQSYKSEPGFFKFTH